MLRLSRILFCLVAVVSGLNAAHVWGQRVHFPTVLEPRVAYQGVGGTTPGFTPNTNTAPGPTTFATPGTTTTPAPTLGGAPPATFQGTVTTPTWDPYANPSAITQGAAPYYGAPAAQPVYPSQPPALFPGGVTQPYPPGGYAYTAPNGSVAQWPRLFKEFRMEYTWLGGNGGDRRLEINSVELTATAQVAFFYNQAPLMVTPGFAFHFWEGPVTTAPLFADLPPRTYDAFLDTSWKPVVTNWLSADLGVRVGVYSDFNNVTTNSIRVMGRGLGVLTFTPQWQVALGIVYYDRLKVKLLPAGGVIWTPDPDTRLEILFPRPKLSRKFTTVGTTDVWGYIGGEYGGGNWTVKRALANDEIDYNDLRVYVGFDWNTLSGVHGSFETGYVFSREIIYRGGSPGSFKPDDTFMVRGVLAY